VKTQRFVEYELEVVMSALPIHVITDEPNSSKGYGSSTHEMIQKMHEQKGKGADQV